MKNNYGLDADYFHKKLKLVLTGINSYTPDELARELGRLAWTASSKAALEDFKVLEYLHREDE